MVLEEFGGLGDGHRQRLGNVDAAETNCQRVAIESAAATLATDRPLLAEQFDFDAMDAHPFARRALARLGVEREPRRRVAAGFGFFRLREDVTKFVEDAEE